MPPNPVDNYLAALQKEFARGDATEHTHRSALKALLECAAPKLLATNEPRAVERENKPDFVVRKDASVIGFVEAKDIGKDLKAVLKTTQLKRYLEALPNLLLTNYLDFMWFVNGAPQLTISLGRANGLHIDAAADAPAQWATLMQSFLHQVSDTVSHPTQLAQILAGQTRLLRDLTLELLSAEKPDLDLKAQEDSFRSLLVPDLKPLEFADMYAQTAAYGLFTARVFSHTTLFGNSPEAVPESLGQDGFSLEQAAYLIPKANPFLRQFFQHIASPSLSPQLRWLVEQIADSLRYADLDKILHRQSRRQGFEDPVFHFYETFLAQYDAKLREQRGVYYTPEPVVDFIVRGVDWLLQDKLGKPDGLADKDTLILDPATGTATFLRKVMAHIHERVTSQGNRGMWPQYVSERLLPRIFGFELMMAPYTVAHLKLALQLQEQGFSFGQAEDSSAPSEPSQRLNIYLTNTLDTLHKQTDAFMSGWIAAENAGAEAVKRSKPVQVVLGNPPYSGESRNKGAWIEDLLAEYKKEPDGTRLQERNSKWLNDDYVKFIRFAHDRINRTGHGVVAFITNHGWLDNPTFRGMRASLMRDFDEIYVIDLHGNSKKKERTPTALQAQGEDKNVFDIEQGVSITFLLKHDRADSFELSGDSGGLAPRKAHIYHHQLWGSRDWKYDWLIAHSMASTPWQTLNPVAPALLLIPRNEGNTAEYERGWKVTDIMPTNSVGIVTARDALTIHFTPQAVRQTVDRFCALSVEQARVAFDLGPDAQDWTIATAQHDLKQSGLSDANIVPIAYRPFDVRYTYYTGRSKGFHCRARGEVMGHFKLKNNLGLAVGRAGAATGSASWDVGFISTCMTEFNLYRRGGNNLFPLWLTPSQGKPTPNLAPQFLAQLAASLETPTQAEHHDLPQGVSAEDVLAYLYAVLHAPSYRSRYAEYLKSDFPRIPVQTCDDSPQRFAHVWQTLLPLGRELMDLHLLKRAPRDLQPSYPVAGDNVVDKPKFEIKHGIGRVCINATQYFEGVSEATWKFKVGGYQVCEKWLKDRKGRALSLDELEHYQRTVAALTRTQVLMQSVDACVDGVLWPAAACAPTRHSSRVTMRPYV